MQINQFNLIEFSEIGSTNEKAVELAEDSAPAWTVVFARKQTRGKGRYQRVWESPADLGLWFSVILRPEIAVNRVKRSVEFYWRAASEKIKYFILWLVSD
ncbi:MAG: hypothetical protein P8048_02185 [Calditrichia bacterium]